MIYFKLVASRSIDRSIIIIVMNPSAISFQDS